MAAGAQHTWMEHGWELQAVQRASFGFSGQYRTRQGNERDDICSVEPNRRVAPFQRREASYPVA